MWVKLEVQVWLDEETQYCVKQIPLWREKNFRAQEAFIDVMKAEGGLAQDESAIRMRMDYLDRLTNGELSNYQLLTIPAADKKWNGSCKKK